MRDGLDLGGAYGATLGRIKGQGGERAKLGMAAMMWISHSRRPLQAEEICRAIGIRIGSNDFDNDDAPAISTLLGCCQGLATIEKGTSTVRLIHFTLQEYLCTHPDLFDRAHSTIAETCLTYLNFQHAKDISAGSSSHPLGAPFLEYSSLYWGTHMRIELSDRAKSLALQLVGQFNGHISAKILSESIAGEVTRRIYPRPSIPDCERFSALHCISYFGMVEVVRILINMGRWDLNQGDGLGVTPLIWAAMYGHEEVVGVLLQEKQVQPDRQDADDGRAALSWAAEKGHEGIVKLLLGQQDVNPDPPETKYNQTPLLWAAQNGHEGIVKLLLWRKDVNPDTPCRHYDRTPLSWAAENGHEGIVKLLLGRKDVNPDSSSSYGRSPLSLAGEKGHEGIVKLLLGRKDVNPVTPDTLYGRTPLSWAANQGHEGVVKLLLERKVVNPDTPDTHYGRTPLLRAANKGHEGIVRLLLGRKEVNPDTPETKHGRTPLLSAAMHGHEGIVKLLLGRKEVNPDTPDMYNGLTPLSWAAAGGYEGIVKLLLERKDVNPNSSNKYDQTPLTLATQYKKYRVVELLQARIADIPGN